MPLTESTNWLPWIAIGIAGLAVVLLALFGTVLLRRRDRLFGAESGPSDRGGPSPPSEQPRGTALERARTVTTRDRALMVLGATLELEEVLARALVLAVSLEGADAAAIVLPQADAPPLVATLGLSAGEAQIQPLPELKRDHPARALSVDYHYRSEGAEAGAEAVRREVVVPLPGKLLDSGGSLLVLWREGRPSPSEAELEELEDLAEHTALAVGNALRFRAASDLAYVDALTGLRNHRFFHETLDREVRRAQRYQRPLALIVFDIDDFKIVNDRIGHLEGDAVLAEVAGRLRSVVRSADVACRVGGDEFAIILPEAGVAEAEQLYRRLQAAMAARSFGGAGDLRLSAGLAGNRPEDDARSLFERADAALYHAKQAGKAQAFSGEGA